MWDEREEGRRNGLTGKRDGMMAFAKNLVPVFEAVRKENGGKATTRQYADYLNRNGFTAPRGGAWYHGTVARLLNIHHNMREEADSIFLVEEEDADKARSRPHLPEKDHLYEAAYEKAMSAARAKRDETIARGKELAEQLRGHKIVEQVSPHTIDL